jgi:hypothetical protein
MRARETERLRDTETQRLRNRTTERLKVIQFFNRIEKKS